MFTINKRIVISLTLLLALAVILYSKISLNYRNDLEGVYILKGQDGKWLTLTDDLYSDEINLLLWGMALPKFKRAHTSRGCTATGACTNFEWNAASGRGFIKTVFPDGKKLIVCLGRSNSIATGLPISGLFLGGGLPAGDPDFQPSNNNETGMTYFDGSRYFHIWCNVNEGIQDGEGKHLLPSNWEYLSSKILENSEQELTITSKHRTRISNVPVSIVRTLFYQTGDTFITLHTTITNTGNSPVFFRYIYGDEPWIGNYYTFSKGNVGWLKDSLVMTESLIDTSKHNFMGMFDYGNPLAGESHNYTGKANFIEWEPSTRPDIAYFSNQFGVVAGPGQNVPLSSYKNRVLSLEWGPKYIQPGHALSFILKIGMADIDQKTGLPVKPATQLY